MTIRLCDCCKKEIHGTSMPIEIPCHIMRSEDLSGVYIDSEGNRMSGRYDKIDLCNKCSNDVFIAAFLRMKQLTV